MLESQNVIARGALPSLSFVLGEGGNEVVARW